MEKLFAFNIMSKTIIAVVPSDTLLEAAKLIVRHNFNGLPVLDNINNRYLVGLLTEYNLIQKGIASYLQPFEYIVEKEGAISDEFPSIRKRYYELAALKVENVMNPDPLFCDKYTPLTEVIEMFSSHHSVNPLPVVDSSKAVIGIISRYDLVSAFNSSLRKVRPIEIKT